MASRSDTGKVSVGLETAFGAGGTLALYPTRNLPSTDGLKEVQHPRDEVVAGNYELPGIKGRRSDSTQTLEWDLHGYTSAAITNYPKAAQVHPDALVAAQAIGNYYVAAGTTAVETALATSDAGSLVLTSATDLVAGAAIRVTDGTDASIHEIAWIKSITANTLTLRDDLVLVTDYVGAKVCLATTIFPTERAVLNSLAAKIETAVLETVQNKYMETELFGMRPSSFKLTWTAAEFLQMAIDYQVANWTRLPVSATAPAAALYPYPIKENLINMRAWLTDSLGVVSCIDASAISVEYTTGWLRKTTTCNGVEGVNDGQQGAGQWRVTIDPLFAATQLVNYSAGGAFSLRIQCGTIPGAIVGFTIPSATIKETPGMADADGQATQPLVLGADLYMGDGASTTVRNNTDLVPTDAVAALCFA
jgi:hypothetical protein